MPRGPGPLLAVVGVPLVVDQLLYNCAVVLCRGQVLGIVPKTYLPNYREFYERRQFAPGDAAVRDVVDCCGQRGVPFGSDLLFQLEEQPLATFHVEICEDLWVPVPPSSDAALAGATVLLNLSASNVTVAKADYRHLLVGSQSGRCLAAYLYSGAGYGESTTDLAWDGHAIIYENGDLLAESRRFSHEPQLVCARDRPRAAGAGADAPDELRARRRNGTASGSGAFDGFRSACRSRSAGGCCPSAATSASRTCPRARSGATPAAPRSTRSRRRGWSSGCSSPASSVS